MLNEFLSELLVLITTTCSLVSHRLPLLSFFSPAQTCLKLPSKLLSNARISISETQEFQNFSRGACSRTPLDDSDFAVTPDCYAVRDQCSDQAHLKGWTVCKRSFSFLAAQDWNSLDLATRTASALSQFRKLYPKTSFAEKGDL